MKRIVAVIIKAALLIAYLILMQYVVGHFKAIAQQTFQMRPYQLILPAAAVLFGAALRSDVFLYGKAAFRADWASLLLIGLPSLLLAFALPGLSLFQSLRLPEWLAGILFWENLPFFSGAICGYTLVNGLFVSEAAAHKTAGQRIR